MQTVLPNQIDAADIQADFNRRADRWLQPHTDALRELIPLAQQSHRDNFNSQASPDGASWPPRKIEGDGHPLLMDKGNLLQAATGGGAGGVTRIEGDALVMGVDLSIIASARAHNLGNPEGNLPQREHLGLTSQRAQEGEHIVAAIVEAEVF